MAGFELPKHFLDAAAEHAAGPMPPVERWNPAYCGEIDMRIARDGRWFYMGTPINRPALVKLFARVLRKDPERYVLVTPVERVGIMVEDAPFLAVEMAPVVTDAGESLAIRTNLDEIVIAGAEHPLRFMGEADGGFKPYIRVRGDLWARFTRALALDLAERIEIREGRAGLSAGGVFFPLSAEAAA
ncbi:DUF1285 domain-containing protein [Rhabdaerophilum calidifontis]|uniref:DUF1285 domain-containing protein n=1 Tax=Rhabdaerophilum calidifontis TaxID=2604328 RepID=UPI001239AF79|nr:DUF1285 domain-containing protein [Rhabdaerophilum calidifontis]